MAIDTNVLVRVLIQDPAAPAQSEAAKRLVDAASAAEPLFVTLCALLKTEWVLRSRYQLDERSIADAFTMLLETVGIELEHAPTLEEALFLWGHHPASELADCMLLARSLHLGCARFVTFDVKAATLPRAELLK